MVGIRDFGAACEGMARESCFFCPDEEEGEGTAAAVERLDEPGSIPPARALSLEVRPRRI